MEWYTEVLKKYAVFSGRARRKEYWIFTLVSVVISIVLRLIDEKLGTVAGRKDWGLLSGIYTLAVLIPTLAVSVRRLHDTGRSGWWLLINLIPCVGPLIVLIFMVQDGERGANQYGPNPKDFTW
jgi:uncharacterized membrane protein YhaH (DUF805 family)